MSTALQLICPQVVTGRASDRLPDVAGQLARVGTHHLAVVGEAGDFLGVIRLSDIAWRSSPGTRILADLVSTISPVTVRSGEPAAAVCALFVQHRLSEAAVTDDAGRYLGLITSQRVLEWNCAELKRTRDLLGRETDALRTAQSLLQSAAVEQEQYLTKLSHDLRSPLNPVLMIASARANAGGLSEDLQRDFRTIAQNASLEAKLIEDLIDAARPSRRSPPPAR